MLTALLAGRANAAVEIEAHLERGVIPVGESTTLEVVVRGGSVNGDPQLQVPDGIAVLSTNRERKFSWINGHASNETVLRFEIGATSPGRFQIGPVVVHVDGQAYRGNPLPLDVL